NRHDLRRSPRHPRRNVTHLMVHLLPPSASAFRRGASRGCKRGFFRSPILSNLDIVRDPILSESDRLHSAPSAMRVTRSGTPTTISQWSAPIPWHFVSIASHGAPNATSAAPERRPRPRWQTGTGLPPFGTPTP